MNDNKYINRDLSTTAQSTQVISKYFTKKDAQMDDSLSEFKETKKKLRCPPAIKPKQRTNIKTTGKANKKLSKEKGQKDIRTALKPKKNKHEIYAKEFKKVCLESGIDVDSEQLQIAIALSKSTQSCENSSQTSTSQSQISEDPSQDKNAKIRTTLLEYGFSVPEINVSNLPPKNKRRIRQRRNSKLFNTTEAERRQKIADKIAQVLFDFSNPLNISLTTRTEKLSTVTNKCSFFYETCSQTFHHLKNDDCFYSGEVVERLPNYTGCLLKDWSKIPGRAVSPSPVIPNEKYFTEFVSKQCDLDVLLSGTLDVVQKLVKALKGEHINESEYELDVGANIQTEIKLEVDNEKSGTETEGKLMHNDKGRNIKGTTPSATDNILLTVPTTARSYSPDMFDDYDLDKTTEMSCNNAEDNSGNCDPRNLNQGCESHTEHLSQTYDNMNNRSNDCMDLTECVNAAPMNSLRSHSDDKGSRIDPILYPDLIAANYKVFSANLAMEKSKKMEDCDAETFDLTQSSESDDSLPLVHLSSNNDISQEKEREVINLDETVQFLEKAGVEKTPEISLLNNSSVKESINNKNMLNVSHELIKPDNKNSNSKMEIKTNKSAIFDDFTFHHSSTSGCNSSNGKLITLDEGNHYNVTQEFGDDNIDLTQSSDEGCVKYKEISGNIEINHPQNIDPVIIDSIPCDTYFSNIDSCNNDNTVSIANEFKHDVERTNKVNDLIDLSNEPDTGTTSMIYDLEDDENMSTSLDTESPKHENFEMPDQNNINLSQYSNAFDVSDEELDYSMQYFKDAKRIMSKDISPQKEEEVNPLGKSVLYSRAPSSNIKTSNNSNTSNNENFLSRNTSLNESLPAVEIKGTKVKIKSPEQKNKISHNVWTPPPIQIVTNMATPSCSEYIIKTTSITPMLDYTALDTPDRNKELEKYGIKPFKRKRAVQLLQHLYYQTHPLVEDDGTKMETPTKRPKIHSDPRNDAASTNVLNSASDLASNKRENIVHEEDQSLEDGKMYEENNVSPVLKELLYDVEDLIFQKKEKAKVHGCRVPLHITFHNYVSGRPLLREAILRYEPVSIDIIHKQMVKEGYRYDAKDLLKFMDKKCITVKTMENSSRNTKKRKS